MGKILLSLVIPAYNVAESIEKCVDSILHGLSTTEEAKCEIIIIDDGSKDGTLEICNKLSCKYSSVKIFSKENGGVSSARNLGIHKSNGEWLGFVDADDVLVPGVISDFLSLIDRENFDIMMYPFVSKYFDKEEVVRRFPDKQYSIYDFLEALPYENFSDCILCAVWNKLYKSSIIKTFNLQFHETIDFGEDFVFNLAFIERCNIVRLYSKPCYIYDCCVENSGVKRFRKSFGQMINIMTDQINHLIDTFRLHDTPIQDYFYGFIANNWLYVTNVTVYANISLCDKVSYLSKWYSMAPLEILKISSSKKSNENSWPIYSFLNDSNLYIPIVSLLLRSMYLNLRKKIYCLLVK